jgi:hypothetical protein
MSEKMQVLLSVILNIETLSYMRNQDEKQLAISLGDDGDINNQSFVLQKNTSDGNNPKSIKIIENIDSFFYLYAPYPIEGTFTQIDGSTFTIKLIDLTIMREAFTSISLRNLDQSQPTTVKAIYS